MLSTDALEQGTQDICPYVLVAQVFTSTLFDPFLLLNMSHFVLGVFTREQSFS